MSALDRSPSRPAAKARLASAKRAWAAVPRDLEQIFGTEHREAPTQVQPPVARLVGADPPSHGATLARLGGLTAAVLVGVAAGAGLVGRGPAPAPPKAQSGPTAAEAGLRPPAAVPAGLSLAAAPAQPAQATAAPSVTVSPPEVAAKAKPALQAKPAHPRPRRRARPERACPEAASGGAWCAHLAVLAADERLRVAYDRAVRRGAPYEELAKRRKAWAKLRRKAVKDPERVIRGYNALAESLDRARPWAPI